MCVRETHRYTVLGNQKEDRKTEEESEEKVKEEDIRTRSLRNYNAEAERRSRDVRGP